LIELEAPVERAFLVGAQLKRPQSRNDGTALAAGATAGTPRTRVMNEHLDELAELVDTAGGIVVGQLTQQIEKPNPATYLGKGKIDELRDRIAETEATLIVFDDELTPAQGKNVEDATGRRVMDRAELILDIFATRARSSEAKMQVELAQLEYMLPRLMRMWTHLEKFRGGIGMRGPGETQLETDRRLINNRIRLLKQRLSDVQKSREVRRIGRKGHFRASLVGYTNAGKSSILKAMSGAESVFVEDRLFATLDPLTREIHLADNTAVLLTDTVGFIRKLPHDLVASFRATLEEVADADLLLHVIDASHPAWEEQRVIVNQVLSEIGASATPVLHVFNKIDLMPTEDLLALEHRITNLMPSSVFVSTVTEDGLEPLKRALLAQARERRPLAEIRLPMSDGKMLAELHRLAEVVEQYHEGEEIVIKARLDDALAGRLKQSGLKVTSGQ
jgi:GTP-binding protein HflX